MKKIILSAAIIALFSASSSFAADEKPIRVFGQVTALSDSKISIKNRSGRNIDLERTSKTTVPSTIKVGDKVAVQVMLTATQVTAIPTKKAGNAAEKTDAAPAAK